MNRLAILDWGIGGFGFWKEWKTHRPNEGALYFSDSGFAPYGKVSDEKLTARLSEVIQSLQSDHGITHCIIACHSASTIVPRLNLHGVTITGIIEGTTDFITETIPPGPLFLAGGRRTIESRTYPDLLPNHDVKGLIAQPLSAAVEAGRLTGPEIHELVRTTLAGTTGDLVLACTHYIAIEKIIRAEFSALKIHDPIPAIAGTCHHQWPAMTGDDLFLTTGSRREMQQGARRAFGIEISESA